MSTIHFLNVLEGDCNIIQHDSGRVSVIDVSNAYNQADTEAEKRVRASEARQIMRQRTMVPNGKIDYGQKKIPDNPIEYLSKHQITSIFRFIITHPDMDHLDGIRDLFESFSINCFWDTNNNKKITDFQGGGYNEEDWQFYTSIRDEKNTKVPRRSFLSQYYGDFFQQDFIHILAPTGDLVHEANRSSDYNDCSYVLLYTPPKANGQQWKILFAGDSHDRTWDYILRTPALRQLVQNVDVLLAPHHGRDSKRSYEFLKVVTPGVTLFGNASHEHLAYNCYPETRITNNQAGYVILDISEDAINFYVKNLEFANNFARNPKRSGATPSFDARMGAYLLGYLK